MPITARRKKVNSSQTSSPYRNAGSLFSPERVRLYPKAAPRKTVTKRRTPKCAVLTGSPEKNSLDDEINLKRTKQKKTSKTNKKVTKQVKALKDKQRLNKQEQSDKFPRMLFHQDTNISACRFSSGHFNFYSEYKLEKI